SPSPSTSLLGLSAAESSVALRGASNCIFLQADDLRETYSGQNLNIKDLFDDPLKFDQSRRSAVAKINHTYATFPLRLLYSNRHTAKNVSFTDFGETDECVGTTYCQAARVTGQFGNRRQKKRVVSLANLGGKFRGVLKQPDVVLGGQCQSVSASGEPH